MRIETFFTSSANGKSAGRCRSGLRFFLSRLVRRSWSSSATSIQGFESLRPVTIRESGGQVSDASPLYAVPVELPRPSATATVQKWPADQPESLAPTTEARPATPLPAWPPHHVVGQRSQCRLGRGIGQALEVFERQPDMVLGALPSVFECSASSISGRGRRRPSPFELDSRLRRRTRRPLDPDRLKESDDRQRQLLLLEISAQALASGPLFTPDIQHVVGDLEGDAQVATVSIEGSDDRFGSRARRKTHRAGTRPRSIPPSFLR